MVTYLSKDAQPEDGAGMTINCYANSTGDPPTECPIICQMAVVEEAQGGCLKTNSVLQALS